MVRKWVQAFSEDIFGIVVKGTQRRNVSDRFLYAFSLEVCC